MGNGCNYFLNPVIVRESWGRERIRICIAFVRILLRIVSLEDYIPHFRPNKTRQISSIDTLLLAAGLRNDLPYTVSHCACDSYFHLCLKEANTETARKIGDLFFNVLKVPCFVWQKEDCHDQGCQEQQKAVLKLPKQFR